MNALEQYTKPRDGENGDTIAATVPASSTPGTQPQAETLNIENDLIFEDTEIKPETFLLQRNNGPKLLPLANLSILKAKMKNGKSFVCTLFASALLSKDWDGQIKTADVDGGGVLYIDTEQSPASSKKIRQRVTKLVAIARQGGGDTLKNKEYEKTANEIRDKFIIANVRKYNVIERKKRIEAIIRRFPDTRLIILDGIKDICTDFNNVLEVAETMDTVTRWALDFNVHILCVLHENPGSDKARGHLGTELYNKATEIVNVERQEIEGQKLNNFVVKWDAIREGEGVEPFNFSIEAFGGDAIAVPRYNATALDVEPTAAKPTKTQKPKDLYKRK